MPNNNVAILSIMSKFDEKSARQAAERANKVYDEALSDIGNVNFDKKLLENFDKAMNLLKNKFKKVNLSSYTNSLLDSIFSDKDIKEKSKDIELFISKIEMLKKASSGQDINAFNTFSAKQIDALISRTEKLAQKQEEINEKTREYNREATKIAKTNRNISTIDKNYGNQDYSKTLESLKKSLGTEKEFTAEQNQSIENLAKMVNLYQVMEKSEPQKGTAEAIRYSKDLLAVTQKIKEERDKIDAFSQKGASAYIANNGLSSVEKVSDYTVNKSKDDFVKANLSNLKTQEAKLQSDLTTYISESVQKNLAKVSKEADAVIDKAEKRVENLQNKIESLQTTSAKDGSSDSVIGNIVSNSDIKTLEEIEDRLYAISDLDADGEATKQQLKEYIQLYKQYEQLITSDSTVKFDPGLKEEYDSIVESDNKLKKYADTLDETISKQKELNAAKSNENEVSVDTQTEQLVKQEEQIKETIQAEKQLQDTQEKISSNTKISVDAEQAIADINKIKESLNSIPEEKNIKITISDSDYTNTPLLSDAEGNTITAFRGVVGAWSGLINQDGIGFFTDKLKLAADYADSLAESGKVYQANLSFKNPLEVEGNGAKWDEIDFNGVKKTTDEIVELAKQLGHDGVIFKNIRDGFTDTDEDISNVMVALNVAQIKNEQVIGSVKAGTGEMVDVANRIDNATDTATNSTVESQNRIQEELKETQKIAEQVSEAMNNVGSDKSNISSETQIKDVFQTSTEKSGMDEVATATEEAVQAKKDFASANESVQSSINDSKSPLQLEAELMDQIAKSARDAAEAKKEFVKANEQVKNSTDDSNDSVSKGKSTNRNKISETDYSNKSEHFSSIANKTLTNNGYTILGGSVSTELVDGLVKVNAKIKTVEGTWKSFSAKIDADGNLFDQKFKTVTKGVNKLEDALNGVKDSQNDSSAILEKYTEKLSDYTIKAKTLGQRNTQTAEYSSAVEKYKQSIESLSEKINYFNQNGGIKTDDDVRELKELQKAIENTYKEINSMSTPEKGSSLSGINTLFSQLYKLRNTYQGMTKEQRNMVNSLEAEWKQLGKSLNLEQAKAQLRGLQAELERTETSTKTLFSALKDKAFYNFASQLGTMFSFYDLINVGREIVTNIKEVDTALTELRKVSDATEQRLTTNFKNSADTAKELGTTISDVISATADWSRMGYNIDQAEELARVSTLYKNVGDGIDIETANNSLISTLQGFQLDASEAESIIDKFNEVANNYAIDSAGIGEALQRSAASFNAANTDLSKSIALITATNEVVQDPDSVGTLWKTMSARIRGAETELEELGEETDEYTKTTSKLRDLVQSLTGFDIMIDEDTFKDVYEIILGIGKEWDNLTDVEQASLGEALAGKRNANALYAVLGNLDTLQSAYETAENSAGSAMREQENYEKSIQYSLDRLSASAQEWSNTLVSSDVIKWFVDLANAAVELSTALTPLGTLALGGGIFAGIKNVGINTLVAY